MAKSKCRSWRYKNVPGHLHAPGACRICWSRCRNKITKHQNRRCDQCAESLLYSNNVDVRRALAKEDNQDKSVLVALTSDANGAIALTATRRLEQGHA